MQKNGKGISAAFGLLIQCGINYSPSAESLLISRPEFIDLGGRSGTERVIPLQNFRHIGQEFITIELVSDSAVTDFRDAAAGKHPMGLG